MLLLDEPTAHLDRESATAVSGAIAALRGKVTVLLVAHDRQTRELADARRGSGTGRHGRVCCRRRRRRHRAAPACRAGNPGRHPWPPGGIRAARPIRSRADEPRPAESAERRRCRRPGPAGSTARGSTAARLRRLLAPVGAKFAAAGAVGTLAALFAVALAGLSGWLIIRASEQPPILYLLTAIVGVRFFGIGRACLRYLERLLLHDAVFAALTRLRGRLWESLSRRALSLRRLLQGGNVLGTVVDDVDTVRELLPRVVLPPLTAVAVAAAAVTGIALLLPAALPAVIAAALVSLVAAPALALAADRMSAGTEQRLRSGVLRQVAAALDARAELHANGVAAPVLAAITRADRSATAASQRSAWAEGLGQGLTVLACGTAALASAVLAAPLALSGAVEASTVAVVVLLQLALVEPYAAITTAVRQYPALRAVLQRIGEAGVLDGDRRAHRRRRVRRAGPRGRQARRPRRDRAPGPCGRVAGRPAGLHRPHRHRRTRALARRHRRLGVRQINPARRRPGLPPGSRRPDPAQRAGGLVPAGGAPLRLDHPRQPAAGRSRKASAGEKRSSDCRMPWPPWASRR